MENQRELKSSSRLWRELKPYLFVILFQIELAGMTITTKFALSGGMSPFTFVVYRHLLAAIVIAPFVWFFERNSRTRLTRSVLLKIILLGFLEPVLDQNMYYLGMKQTSAAFTAAICNLLPAVTFILAWIFRLENVNWNDKRSIAKVLGTTISVSGAMLMTLYKGSMMRRGSSIATVNQESRIETVSKDFVKGSVCLVSACFFNSGFVILQAVTLREYPLELSLVGLTCLSGAAMGIIPALLIEHDIEAWLISWDSKLLAIVYSAVICTGIGWCLQGRVAKDKGPVFVAAFSPLSMIIVSIVSLFFLAEDLLLGSLIGAILIICGLYMVVWGKRQDQRVSPEDQEGKIQMAATAMDA